MANSDYSVTGIHLPENEGLVLKAKKVARIICIAAVVTSLLGRFMGISLWETMIFILIAAPLIPRMTNKTPVAMRFWLRMIPMVCGVLVLAGAGWNIYRGFWTMGICFVMAGWAIILPRTNIVHRFHAVQLLALFMMLTGWLAAMAGVYGDIAQIPLEHLRYMPFGPAIMFTMLGGAILLRWPGRGLMAIFFTETLGSVLASRLLVINSIIAPVAGLGWILTAKAIVWSSYEATVLTVMLQIMSLLLLTWFNVRILYRAELERLVMREASRVHDVGMKLDSEQLEAKISELEQVKQKYAENLNYQERFRNLADYFD